MSALDFVGSADRLTAAPRATTLEVAALFAGIGGIEKGLARSGHRVLAFCESDPAAVDVLRDRFGQHFPLTEDVAELDHLPAGTDVVAAGFPCQDLSQAGRTAGIAGGQSGLVYHIFRLLTQRRDDPPRWLFLENVPFMLQLDGGRAMHRLTEGLAELGYRWAYRVVDTRAFGLPQRRRRVLLLASVEEDPRGPLLAEDVGEPPPLDAVGRPCGFYWTEGQRGLGLAVDAVPTLKGGSSVGIPSPPAVWIPGEGVFTPDVRDAERLQGFNADWTSPAAVPGRRAGVRWKLVGNAVSVPVAAWVGDRLAAPRAYSDAADVELPAHGRWPDAAWGDVDERWAVPVSAWPRRAPVPPLLDFLEFPLRPLSARASGGFLSRARAGNLTFPDGFLADVAEHHRTVTIEG